MSHKTESFSVTKAIIMPTASDPTYGHQEAINLNPQAEDCYFYFYSTCTKGEGCKYRHCSAALGSEQICEQWSYSGTCKHKVCAFRHSQMLHQRSVIACYWEGQPQGCQKPHCPFMHSKPRTELKNAQIRLRDYKMAAIKIKSVEELKKDRGVEADQNVKLKEESGQGTREELLDLHRELIKRIVAEKVSFKERLGSQQKQVPIDLSVARGEGRKDLGMNEVASPRADVKTLRVRPTVLCIDSTPKQQRSASTSHCRAAAVSDTSKPHVDMRAGKPHGDMRAGIRQSNRISTSSTAHVVKTKITPTNPLCLDFKIKTLEELRAERGHCTAPPWHPPWQPPWQPLTRDVCVAIGEQAAKKSGTNQQRLVSSEVTELGRSNKVKKVFLVRRRQSQDVNKATDSINDNNSNNRSGSQLDDLKLLPAPDSGGRKLIPESGGHKPNPESGGQKPIPELGGQNPIPESDGRITIPQSDGRISIPEFRGGKSIPESHGQKSIPEPGRHKRPIPESSRRKCIPGFCGHKPISEPGQHQTIPESGGQKPIPESGGQKCIPESGGQKSIPESDGHKSIPGSRGWKSIPESRGRKSIPESRGRKSIPESGGRKSIPESGGQKSIPESRGRKSIPDISVTLNQKEKSKSITRPHLKINPHFNVGSILKSSFDVESNSDSYIATGLLVKRSHDQMGGESEGGDSETKKRKVTLHRKKRRHVEEVEETTTAVGFCSADKESVSATPEINIVDLKNELLGDVNGVLGADIQDKMLLEEMAQYEEEDDLQEEAQGQGRTMFSDSKNDDELLLQMEEFM